MTALGVYAPNSPEWHAARRFRIGGSEIATVCDWSPFETRDELLARKLGVLEPKPTSKAMDRGNRLEGAILLWLCDKHGLTVDPEASAATHVHPAIPWALFNADAVTTDGVLLEAKTAADRSEEKGWGRAGSDKVPLYYASQVQFGMGVLGLPLAHIGVLHGATNGRPDLSFSSYTIKADPKAFAFLVRKGQQFIDELNSKREVA